jgi:hypothetical protein
MDKREPQPPPRLPDVGHALRASEDKIAASQRRALLLGLGAIAIILIGAFVLPIFVRPGPPNLAELAKSEAEGWKGSEFIAPPAEPAGPEGGPGEEAVLPFDGFGVSADSSPGGARVYAADRLLGVTPVASSVDCQPGQEVQLRFELAGHRPKLLTTRCRKDALVKIRVRLQ